MPFWQRTEGVRANNKRAVLVVYSKESPCLLRCTIALPKKSSVEPDAPTTVQSYGMLFCFGRRSEGVQGASGKPPACVGEQQLCRKKFPTGGIMRRLQRGLGLAVLWVSRQLRCPKVSKGRAESPLVRPQAHTPVPEWPDAPTTARTEGLPP